MFGIFYAFILSVLFTSSYNLVHEYTDSDFDGHMTGKRALVMFFSPSCGHCVRLKPTYTELSTSPSILSSEVDIVKVDCSGKGTKTCSKYGVGGFPTVKYISRAESPEKTVDYQGDRSLEDLERFVLDNSRPPISEVPDSEIASFITSLNLPVVFGFFKDAKSKLFQKLVSLAESHKGKFVFGYSFSSDQAKQLGHKQDSVVLFRQSLYKSPLEESVLESTSEKDLPKFLSDNSHSIVELMTPKKQSEFSYPLIVVYLPLDANLQKSTFRRFRNVVIKIAKEKKEITFAVSTRDMFRPLIEDIAPEAGDKDIHIVAFQSEDDKYPSKEHGSLADFKQFEPLLAKFVSDFLKGDVLEKFIKSEPIPESQEGNVVTVVAKNIDQVVFDNDKDVFIEFYAPWCGHCKKLAPKFEELATLLKDEEKLVIGKMDATANEVDKRFTVEGFPTIFLLKAGDKDHPIQYDGKRDVSSMFKWIKEHATHPITFDGELPSSKDEL